MTDDAPSVSLVGDGSDVAALGTALDDGGIDVHAVDHPADGLPSAADLVVAVGERAVADVATCAPSVPVVPVGAGPGIRSISPGSPDSLVAAIEAGDWGTERHVPLSVCVGEDIVGTAVFDVTLVTAEPARISEYEVFVDGNVLDRSRADGVVVTTPAGSTDYARRVDAPVLAPGTGVAVAWIAPFRTDPDRWVVDPDVLEVHVEREEATVDLLLDERVMRTIGPDETVTVRPADPFEVAVFDAGRNRYE